MDPQLDRIEAKLDRLLSKPVLPVISLKEAGELTGYKSKSGLLQFLRGNGIGPIGRGKYRRVDVMNAIGRLVTARNSRRALDREIERVQEGQGGHVEPNFHD